MAQSATVSPVLSSAPNLLQRAQARLSTLRARQSDTPTLHYRPSPENQRIIAQIPQLTEAYQPTPWLYNAHLQLICLAVRKVTATPPYDHYDHLTMKDGGRTALAWLGYPMPADTPTIVIMHTITGSPQSMQELVQDVHRLTGWRVVVCVRRGHAKLPLTVPKLNILGSTQDLYEQLDVIQSRFPESPLYAIGSSAGSGLLARYLGETGERSVFRAAFAYCPGYDTSVGFDRVHPTYSRLMARKLIRQFIRSNHNKLAHLPSVLRLQGAKTLAEFHQEMYELAGYPDRAAYEADCNPMHVFFNITTPFMILNADDDPICRIENAYPYLDQIKAMPNAILVTTTVGSHCAHYEGWQARSWSNRLMANYFLAVHTEA